MFFNFKFAPGKLKILSEETKGFVNFFVIMTLFVLLAVVVRVGVYLFKNPGVFLPRCWEIKEIQGQIYSVNKCNGGIRVILLKDDKVSYPKDY